MAESQELIQDELLTLEGGGFPLMGEGFPPCGGEEGKVPPGGGRGSPPPTLSGTGEPP